MKLKKKVIKFRKAKTDYTAFGHHEIAGTSIICVATEIAQRFGGYVCSFRDKDNFDMLKCKLVIRIPEKEWPNFVNAFSRDMLQYICEVSW